jgi:hypothetical protein
MLPLFALLLQVLLTQKLLLLLQPPRLHIITVQAAI